MNKITCPTLSNKVEGVVYAGNCKTAQYAPAGHTGTEQGMDEGGAECGEQKRRGGWRAMVR